MNNENIAAHTPGSWKVRAGFDGDTKEIFRPNPKIKKPFYPIELAVVRSDDAEGRANARLIAAAPDLLEALNNILVGMEASGGWVGDDDLFDAGMRAYNKATRARP